MRTSVRMRSYTYTVAEHDPARPWILVGEIRRLTVELEDGQNFYEWAVTEWPGPRFKVERDPWQTPGSSSAIAPERAP
jgi:hypothetical protein